MGYLGFTPGNPETFGQRTFTSATVPDSNGIHTIDAGSGLYHRISVTGNTTFLLDFTSITEFATDVIGEFNLDGAHTVTFGDTNQTIEWNGGTPPSLTTGTSLIRFHSNTQGEIFGQVIGTGIA